MEKPSRPPDRRLSALSGVLAVLEAVGRTGIVEAVEIRKALESGNEPDRRLVRSVESALLVALMSSKLPEEETRPADAGLLSAASGVFRKLMKPVPTRQQARRAYKEFERAFAGRSAG